MTRADSAPVIRIAHIISNLDLGGAETMLAKLVQHSDRSRFAHFVVSLTSEGAYANVLRQEHAEVCALGMSYGRPGLVAPLRGLRMLRAWKPAVVQTWLYHADLFGVVGRMACHAPLVWNIRCSEHDGLRSALTRVCALFSRAPDVVVVNSNAGRRVHEGIGYRPVRWERIPNGFDVEALKPTPGVRDDVRRELGLDVETPLVGLVARVDPLKDHTTFLRAAELLSERNPRVHFVLVGDGTEALRFTRPMDHTAAAGRIRLLGRRYDVARLTAAMDVCTCSSVAEGFPNVVGEAMACGVPCVVTDVGDAADIVGDTGVVVPSRDAEALARGWAHVLDLPAERRAELGIAARRRICDHYRLDTIVARYEQLWSSLAHGATAHEEQPVGCVG